MKMMKCDPRAFARCPYRKECSDSPEHTSFYVGTECDYFNQQVIHAPLTNADRIRAMSDDELATMLFDYKECNKNCIMSSEKHCYEICEEESVILKWLQQPAEED